MSYKSFIAAPPNTYANNESDTNADTCCLGSNFVIISYTRRTADVYPYDSSYAPINNVPIVTGATAYDDPNSGNTYLLIFNESLFYGNKLDHTLVNPNQLRHHGIHYYDNPFDKTHDLAIEIPGILRIPLTIRGTKIFFSSRTPTNLELDTITQEYRIELTSSFEWDPSIVTLSSVIANRDETSQESQSYHDDYNDTALLSSISPHFTSLRESIISTVNLSLIHI